MHRMTVAIATKTTNEEEEKNPIQNLIWAQISTDTYAMRDHANNKMNKHTKENRLNYKLIHTDGQTHKYDVTAQKFSFFCIAFFHDFILLFSDTIFSLSLSRTVLTG